MVSTEKANINAEEKENKMEETIANVNPLGTEKIGKLMMRFAIPSIISLVINSLYNMVDQVFIGQGVGYLGNAATNVILPLNTLHMAIMMMIGDGAAAFMSLNLGKDKADTAARGVGNAVTLTVGIGVIYAILSLIFLKPLCQLFGATENTMPYALEYGKIIAIGYLFVSIDIAFGSIIRADGRPNTSMIGLLIGCITNLILDPLFIFVFKWGVAGAAWATIIGQFLNAVYYIICMFRFKTIRLKKEHLFLKGDLCKRIASMGTSSFILQVALVAVMTTMNNVLVKYGAESKYGSDIPMAALGVTMKVSQLVTNVAVGLASGIQPIYGYNYGSGRFLRVKKLYKWALLDSTLILLIALAVFQIFPEPIINLFGQESDLYMKYAVKCFRIYLLGCFMIGANAVTGVFFQSIGKSLQSALLSLSRQIVFLVPGLIILGHFTGVEGLLWAGPISDILAGVISLITVFVYWKSIFFENASECF